jgi:hypothetical protein
MKSLLSLTFALVVASAVPSCTDQQVIVPALAGTYDYVGYDSSGTPVVHGSVAVKMLDSVRISGTWNLSPVGSPQNIGPQTGRGTISGTLEDDTLCTINLNPQWVDNNVLLQGTFRGESITGRWSFITYAGEANRGTFTARKLRLPL